MNLDAVIIANDLALHCLIEAMGKNDPQAAATFAASLDTIAIESTSQLHGELGNAVRNRLSALAAAAVQPTRQGAPLQ